jgi:hypothetical protein
MSNTDWAADVQRRAVVNQDRRKREVAARMKKGAAAVAAAAYGPPHCPGLIGTQGSVSSPTSLRLPLGRHSKRDMGTRRCPGSRRLPLRASTPMATRTAGSTPTPSLRGQTHTVAASTPT